MRKLFSYEKRHQPVASRAVFYNRHHEECPVGACHRGAFAAVGTAGYAYFEGMLVLDAFANAAMILSGMGPLTPLYTAGGKIFASIYAVVSGLLLFAIAGLMLAPIYHRILHRFHVDAEDEKDQPPARRRKR